MFQFPQKFSTLIILSNVSWAANQHIKITVFLKVHKDWSNDAENSLLHNINNDVFEILKFIKIESYFTL